MLPRQDVLDHPNMVVAEQEEAEAHGPREETALTGLMIREGHLSVTSGTNLGLAVVTIIDPHGLLPLAASGAEKSTGLGIDRPTDIGGGRGLHMEETDDTEVPAPGDDLDMTVIRTSRSRDVRQGTYRMCRSLSWMTLTGKDDRLFEALWAGF